MAAESSHCARLRAFNEACLDRIRAHPFIQEAHRRHLTRDQSERWILCAGRESYSFPAILERMIERSSIPAVREILVRNLEDEYGNGKPEEAHFRHYLQLLEDLGIPREHFEAYRERAGIRLALNLAYNVSSQSREGIALGYMLVNEGMTPITYEAARSTLTHYYPDLRTVFFDLHIAVDEQHVADLYRAIEAMPAASAEDVAFGISVGERGMAVLLDEVLGVFDHEDCDTHLAAIRHRDGAGA
jgi:pyrroloquinoline quinone (PQQ) biosynthesis protein C